MILRRKGGVTRDRVKVYWPEPFKEVREDSLGSPVCDDPRPFIYGKRYIEEKGVTPEKFHSDMDQLLRDYKPGCPKSEKNMQAAFAYMAQMLAWTGFRDGAEIALTAAKRKSEVTS